MDVIFCAKKEFIPLLTVPETNSCYLHRKTVL